MSYTRYWPNRNKGEGPIQGAFFALKGRHQVAAHKLLLKHSKEDVAWFAVRLLVDSERYQNKYERSEASRNWAGEKLTERYEQVMSFKEENTELLTKLEDLEFQLQTARTAHDISGTDLQNALKNIKGLEKELHELRQAKDATPEHGFMSAADARARTIDSQLCVIEKEVDRAIEDNKHFIIVSHENLSEETAAVLRRQGFGVVLGKSLNSGRVFVSWGQTVASLQGDREDV